MFVDDASKPIAASSSTGLSVASPPVSLPAVNVVGTSPSAASHPLGVADVSSPVNAGSKVSCPSATLSLTIYPKGPNSGIRTPRTKLRRPKASTSSSSSQISPGLSCPESPCPSRERRQPTSGSISSYSLASSAVTRQAEAVVLNEVAGFGDCGASPQLLSVLRMDSLKRFEIGDQVERQLAN